MKLYLIGSGGHAKVLADLAALSGLEIQGAFVEGAAVNEQGNLPVLGGDNELARLSPAGAELINGVGGVRIPEKRAEIFRRWKQKGFSFRTLVHPSAVVSQGVRMGEGVQVMAGAVVQAGAWLGDNVIVNTGALVDHDCRIGDHVHLAPGVVLSGAVTVGECSLVGAGAVVIQGVEIGERALVAAGAVVVRAVPAGKTVFGMPAKGAQE
jgi:sugar O-acyltransferase (sialic acid O-acetyltransferase NeuD family)